MKLNYNPLWKMLIDKEMNRTELAKKCNISSVTISRMGKNLPVSLDVIERVCTELNCKIEDIVEIK